jgi:two-component system, cell cycle sensor histidine kinase and response regulator CckA
MRPDPRGEAVIVSVSEDGPGMPPEVLGRCMEPYFSTKVRGASTGMGLALVHGLVTPAGDGPRSTRPSAGERR